MWKQYIAKLSDKEKMMRLMEDNKDAIKFWLPFAGIGLVLFWLFSDWDFSLLLTTSSLTSMFAFLMVCLKIEMNKSARGVSLKMFECYFLLLACRLCSIIPFQGYLPLDRSGDWLYQTIEMISLGLVGLIIYMCRKRYAATYSKDSDVFKHYYLAVGCFILALILHPYLNAFMPADVCWTFALYLESMAVLPQLFMFQKDKRVEPFTTHFLAGQAASRVCLHVFVIRHLLLRFSHSYSGSSRTRN
jgi:uncharacterized protein with PQ loop repeat